MTPEELAKQAVLSALSGGSDKDGVEDVWMTKSIPYHLTRAIRHTTTALMIYSHLQPDDEDGVKGHLENAMTRLAMGIWLMTYKNTTP
jgi:hypothetical protein